MIDNTHDSYLNGRKVNKLYSVNLGCGNCQEQPYRLGDGSVTLSKAEMYKTDENPYVQNLFGIYILKEYPCRACPFGGKCYLGKSTLVRITGATRIRIIS